MYFPAADIELSPFIPPLIACTISFFTSMAGVSGAFLLLPFQVSVLGFDSPAVSSTNHLYNIVAIPSGIYRFIKEGRMLWPLTWLVTIGTLPGVLAGVIIRINYLPSPRAFKFFVGFVLFYIGVKLCMDILKNQHSSGRNAIPQERAVAEFRISSSKLSVRQLQFTFNDIQYKINTISVICLSLTVGLIGGVYGIGGGAIIAPFFVSVYRLPVHTVAGASLMGTFLTSAVGVLFFQFLATTTMAGTMNIAPDYRLGLLFGIGGAVGMYLGARAQRFFPAQIIKAILTAALLFTAFKYIFWG